MEKHPESFRFPGAVFTLSQLLYDAACDEAARLIVAGEIGDYDACGIGRGVYELVVADIYADVADVVGAGIEAQQIAGLKRVEIYGFAVGCLVAGDAVELYAEV